jgi:hypothetical protein
MALLDAVYQWVYPLKPQERKRTKPMKILCLGLPRTATDSLRVALTTLGYDYVYHGFDHIADARDCVNWVQLWSLKTSGKKITRADFDRVIGHCEAVTDAPACCFAEELVEAYPEAKIIVNYREDVEAWHRSVVTSWSTAEERAGWVHPILCWFHARMFWVNVNEHRLTYGNLWRNDYRKYAKDTYRDHYAMLRGMVKGMGKDKVLEFKAQDGWGPLCEFLGKGIPDAKYPNRNALEEVVAKVLGSLMQDSNEAWRNMALTLGMVVAAAGTFVWLNL